MKARSYTKRVNNRIIIASEGINFRYRDYFKITDYRVSHVLHQDIPTTRNKYYPTKMRVLKMDASFNIFLMKKLVELI